VGRGASDAVERVGDLKGAIGQELGVPPGLVEQVVVSGAQQNEVRELRRSAEEPGAHVMALAPGRRPITAREPATVVADDEGVEQRGGDGAGGGAVVEDG
jgi:hypothetical protein